MTMNTQPIIGEGVISTEQLISLELRRAVTRETDWIAEQVGNLLEEIGKTDLTNNQINGLLAVANTTDKVTDVVRFLERQGSRHETWQRYSERLISEIRGTLLNLANDVANNIQKQMRDYHQRNNADVNALTDRRGRLPEVHLLLVREFIQSFCIGYLYRFPKD